MIDEAATVSLFTGAGGLDIGLERAGFRTASANDIDPDCLATLRVNQQSGITVANAPDGTHLAGTNIVASPIDELSRRDLIPPGASRSWRPALLAGGPPCQPFSSAGAQRSVHDPRGRLFEEFMRLADELRPAFVLFENVRGLVTARGSGGKAGEALLAVRRGFEDAGYGCRFALLNAADYGAPQRRVRLFMIGASYEPLPEFPPPTHGRMGNGAALFEELKPWVPLDEFLNGMLELAPEELVRPSPELAHTLALVRDGSGLRSPGRSEPTRPGGHWGYKQGTFVADRRLPARTVTAASTQDWIRLHDGTLRRLTLRECAALQGFPPDWVFIGSKASQFRQVGNAVPAIFGEILGEVLLGSLKLVNRRRRAESAELPPNISGAISYANRDDERNGSVRPRSPRFGQPLRT